MNSVLLALLCAALVPACGSSQNQRNTARDAQVPGVDASSSSSGDDAGARVDAASDAYADIEALVRRSCAFDSCHGGDGEGEAHLNFASVLARHGSLTEVLNGVPSCEAPGLARVEPFAPQRSWLMLKLSAAHDEEGRLTSPPIPEGASDAAMWPDDCPMREDGGLSYGQLMPISGTRSRALPESEIAQFRAWIERGAPGRP